ncbi:unnamed protein product [Toxocara canis]|uniref:SMAP domain-containing protein n=1 Tax=Toxocara canis TaxID=6265 RepID=A0A183V8Z5_TOXCA|nr:unnamed protein product [Toxocara canis]
MFLMRSACLVLALIRSRKCHRAIQTRLSIVNFIMPSPPTKLSHQRLSSSSGDSDGGSDRQRDREEHYKRKREYDRDDSRKRNEKKNVHNDDSDRERNRDGGRDSGREREKRGETDGNGRRKRSRENDELEKSHREECMKRMDGQDKERRREATNDRERHRRERSSDKGERRHDRDIKMDRRGYLDKFLINLGEAIISFMMRLNNPTTITHRLKHKSLSLCSHEEEEEKSSDDRPAWATKAVMKRAEEIQQRKLLWSKPEEKKGDGASSADAGTTTASASGSRPSIASTWNSILAAASTDSKQIDKFKRLMGMKKSDEPNEGESNEANKEQVEAERQRQRALYSHLDQQYAIARSTTHLSRGQGLGFHS